MENKEQQYMDVMEQQLVVGYGLQRARIEDAPKAVQDMYRNRMDKLNASARQLQVEVNERNKEGIR